MEYLLVSHPAYKEQDQPAANALHWAAQRKKKQQQAGSSEERMHQLCQGHKLETHVKKERQI
jgi:hypothetical protein